MTVAELIEELQKLPQDLSVEVLENLGYGEMSMEPVREVRIVSFGRGEVVWLEA